MWVISKKISDSLKIARNIAKKINPGDTLIFIGELGSGKTTIIQEICKYFGVKDRVNSPTFNYYKIYKTKYNFQIIHIDAYRLNPENQILLDDFINDKNIKLIEWPEKINIPCKCKTIFLIYSNHINERRIQYDF
ncbi:MAG: UPF0079 ATP-binding protein [Candidatus Berkelbacteria bacterium Licking1014_85]|uniref:tRNA threonylcarbamoyladenosine biosynthesis protein TsaE n=1 Tax=Candidatus Berkelbacteria bacterium Licking1014_85 TaxID=2017148 RepID=A0A554LK54_9BACT|nr:MAG: UPF0079 ATP-binding protein [Candidatus Berkelbacteria bacterium Licking1014_85]